MCSYLIVDGHVLFCIQVQELSDEKHLFTAAFRIPRLQQAYALPIIESQDGVEVREVFVFLRNALARSIYLYHLVHEAVGEL